MKFFLGFLGSLFFCFLLWCGLVFGQMGNPTKMSQWVWDTYEKKIEIAETIDEKKVVIVAGSNALFGVDSKILSHTLKMRILNFGVNAGVELPLTLYMAKKVIHRGDLVLVPLEYPMYSYEGNAGLQMIDYIFSREESFFWELTLYEQFYMLWHIGVKRVYNGYFNESKKAVTSGLYGAHHIDENGDQINISLKFRKKWMIKELNKHVKNPEIYGKKFNKDALGWKYLEKFVKWCENRDVKVIFMPSTLMKSESYFKKPKEKWFYENLSRIVREKGWEYKGEPYEYMYDKSQYFNTNFHLIMKARKMRTLQMIEDLIPISHLRE